MNSTNMEAPANMIQKEEEQADGLTIHEDGSFTIRDPVPEGVEIRDTGNGTGLGLYATRSFSKGEAMFSSNSWTVPRDRAYKKKPITLITQHDTYKLDTWMHAEPYEEDGKAWLTLYAFDAFVNHSCDANTSHRDQSEDSDGYDTFAVKDIEAGDEITCDYDLYTWDENNLRRCMCGTDVCRGRIKGFKHIEPSRQKELLPFVDWEVAYEYAFYTFGPAEKSRVGLEALGVDPDMVNKVCQDLEEYYEQDMKEEGL